MGKKNYQHDNEISELLNVTLGGYEQKILIEGKRKELPVVLTLHGGPGTPIPFSVGCRGLFPEFTDKFIMVYWDQYGCGINNHIITDTFTMDNFVQMTEELVIELKKMFPDNKFLIFSTSWGSVLSAMLLDKNPYAVDSVVACGQIIKNVCFCDEVFQTLKDSRISRKKLEHIKAVTVENHTGKDLQLIFSSLKNIQMHMKIKPGRKPQWVK
ncbi:MAG: alpha/beta fold hydrolase [Roseburia sp.]|nr:alpha/beta fold hydrolase [Roseburia sp.]